MKTSASMLMSSSHHLNINFPRTYLPIFASNVTKCRILELFNESMRNPKVWDLFVFGFYRNHFKTVKITFLDIFLNPKAL